MRCVICGETLTFSENEGWVHKDGLYKRRPLTEKEREKLKKAGIKRGPRQLIGDHRAVPDRGI